RSAWAFSAAISLGELNAVLMLGLEGWETLPLLVYRAAGAYRYGTACAAGTLLMACCAGAFLLSEAGAKRSVHGT
ncbi:MAG: iron ABC transporter permease, partial [Spirochaetaceae bacterium]|nr:iron ABC transporter permease [Spirochaetaceae bacterium]